MERVPPSTPPLLKSTGEGLVQGKAPSQSSAEFCNSVLGCLIEVACANRHSESIGAAPLSVACNGHFRRFPLIQSLIAL
jgi:hypothetical protein